MIWAVWRDAEGNLGVSQYPDVQLAAYGCKALDRVLLDVCEAQASAHTRRRELEAKFAAMTAIDTYTGHAMSDDEPSGDYFPNPLNRKFPR